MAYSRSNCAAGGMPAVLGLSYVAAAAVYALSSGWPALCASALVFAHPFALWDVPRLRGAPRWLALAAAIWASIVLAMLCRGAQGLENATPWQAFVWTVLAVSVFPLALDSLVARAPQVMGDLVAGVGLQPATKGL